MLKFKKTFVRENLERSLFLDITVKFENTASWSEWPELKIEQPTRSVSKDDIL